MIRTFRLHFSFLAAMLFAAPAFATAKEAEPFTIPGDVVAPAPSPLQELAAQFLTPTGIASAVVTLLGLVGGALGLSERRKRQIAIVTQHAFYGVEDFAKTTESTVDDKVAAGLKIANDWMIAHGWRPISASEVPVVELGFKSLHGSTLVNERAAETAATSVNLLHPETKIPEEIAKAISAPAVPQSP